MLATGVLERGNGKPLSLFERMIGTMIEAPEKMANGVVPDHRLDEKGASANDIRWSLRKADSVRTAPDPAEAKAIDLLERSLKKSESDPKPAARVRQPVALWSADGGTTVLVANQRSGSVSVIDAATRKVVAEHEIGRSLADLAMLPGGRRLLAVDGTSNELLLIEYGSRTMRVIDRLPVGAAPIRLAVLAGGRSCAVASLWSRRLTFASVVDGPSGESSKLALLGDLELPFCARELASLAGSSKLVVADAFGGRLAVVETKDRRIDRVRTIPGHNIRGMAVSPDGQSLLIAHQRLDHLAQTTIDDVHWGLLIRNHLRVLPIDALFKAAADSGLLDRGRLFDLGDVGYAAGDPGAIAFDTAGNLIVALAGVDEIAITAGPDQGPRRIVVGHRPAAVRPARTGWLFMSPTV